MENSKYVLVAFPYPSGAGLHMGHSYAYGLMDSYCRSLRSRGHHVFQPFGFDTHGLPTELYAKKVGRPPLEVAEENIINFRSQMERMSTQYETLLSTHDPVYVKWTQWIFSELHKRGLAYKKKGQTNWCPSCETVISCEDECDRCGTLTEDREQDQWYIRITDYRERLIKGLDEIDMPDGTKKMQRKWIEDMRDWSVGRQRSFGTPVPLEGETDTLDTFFDSSWYFVRYCDPNNDDTICSPENYRHVDVYCCGAELATNHLIYARFIHMFLYDIGVVPVEEPFKKVIHNGMIIGLDGHKMSKSRGNVVDPNDYDPDEMRLYLAFLAHFFDGGVWSDRNIKGVRKFLFRYDEWMSREGEDELPGLDKFISNIHSLMDSFKFNKVVSEYMTLVNKYRHLNLTVNDKNRLTEVLSSFVPSLRK